MLALTGLAGAGGSCSEAAAAVAGLRRKCSPACPAASGPGASSDAAANAAFQPRLAKAAKPAKPAKPAEPAEPARVRAGSTLPTEFLEHIFEMWDTAALELGLRITRFRHPHTTPPFHNR